MSAPNNAPILKICSEINSKTHRFDYQLVIDKFKSLRQKGFRSDMFSPPGLAEPKFYLECSPEANQAKYDMKISLFVCDKRSNVYVKFDIKGIDESGEQQFGSKSKFGQSVQILKSIVLCEFFYPWDFCGDKLKILCEFTFDIDSYATQTVLPSLESSSNFVKIQGCNCLSSTHKSAHDVDTMLENGKFSDVEIVIGNRSFHAHKFMLAARSPVFAAMFEHDFEENRSNRVEITDVDEDIFVDLLRYIYADVIPPMHSNAEDVLAVADKYELNELKDACGDRLEKKLTVYSMYDILLLAHNYNADKLKNKAINYILSHFPKGRDDSQNVALTTLFQNHLSANLIEAMRNFDQEANRKDLKRKF